MFAKEAADKISILCSGSMIDLGCGVGWQSNYFLSKGFTVTSVDILAREKTVLSSEIVYIQSFVDKLEIHETFDCVWSSHVVEHMLDVQSFLIKCIGLCKERGYIAISFPPLKHQIVGGHVNLLNPGILLYRLVLAGIDCSQAMVKQSGYNCSIIVNNTKIKEEFWSKLRFDNGDIETISKFLPEGHNKQGFNGDIKELNW